MARPTADTAQITFRLPTKWLEQADKVAASLALAGRPMGRTDGVRALIAAGLFLYEPEVMQLVERVASNLAARSGHVLGREDTIKTALQIVDDHFAGRLKTKGRKTVKTVAKAMPKPKKQRVKKK